MSDLSFPKLERLKSKKRISKVFQSGKALYKYPLRVLYLEVLAKSDVPVKVAFSVPKRKIARAVDRNSVKRKMNESYRLHRKEIFENVNFKSDLELVFVYTMDEVLDSKTIEKSTIKLLKEIKKTLD